MFLRRVCEILRAHAVPFAIVGGYAVALHGVVRGTFDIDLITELSEGNLSQLQIALAEIGLRPSLPLNAGELYVNLDTYRNERNLLPWNFINPHRMREVLDVVLTEDVRNMETQEIATDFGIVATLTIDSLIAMKSRANREQDKKDIAALQELQRKNNASYPTSNYSLCPAKQSALAE